MQSVVTSFKLLAFSAVVCTLSACATKPVFTANFESMQFASHQPDSISIVWRNAGDAWVVPAKNVMIEGANVNGQPLRMVIDGAYFKVIDAPASFNLRISGVDEAVKFSEK